MKKIFLFAIITSVGFSLTDPIAAYKAEHPDIVETTSLIQPEDLAYRTLAQNIGVDEQGVIYENGIMAGGLNFFNAVSSSPLKSARDLFSKTPDELFQPMLAVVFQAVAEQAAASCSIPDLARCFTRAHDVLKNVEDLSGLTIQFFCYRNHYFDGEFPSDIYAFTLVQFTDESVLSDSAAALEALQSETPYKASVPGIMVSAADTSDDAEPITITRGHGQWPLLHNLEAELPFTLNHREINQTTIRNPIRYARHLRQDLTFTLEELQQPAAYTIDFSPLINPQVLQRPLVQVVEVPTIEGLQRLRPTVLPQFSDLRNFLESLIEIYTTMNRPTQNYQYITQNIRPEYEIWSLARFLQAYSL